MAVFKTIRVIRTWDIEVEAEYGDTHDDLMAKVSEETLDTTEPTGETRVVIPGESPFGTLQEYESANPVEEEEV